MATCHDIIDRAMRTMGVLAAGETASGHDAAEGMGRLREVIDTLPLLRNGDWTEVRLTDAAPYAASDGERIHTQGHATTIMFPAEPQDMSRVQVLGAGHAQEGLWVHSATKGAWARVDRLEIGDDSPFGPDDDAGLAAMVAVGLAEAYGAEVSAITANRAGQTQSSLRARLYREPTIGCVEALLALSDLGLGAREGRGD